MKIGAFLSVLALCGCCHVSSEDKAFITVSMEMISTDATLQVMKTLVINHPPIPDSKVLGPVPMPAHDDALSIAETTLGWFQTSDRLLQYAMETGQLDAKGYEKLTAALKRHPELKWVVLPGNKEPLLLSPDSTVFDKPLANP